MKINHFSFLWISAIVLLVIISISSGFEHVIHNISGIYDLQKIVGGNSGKLSDCQTAGIDYYPSLASCINESLISNTSVGLELIDKEGFQNFPDRKVLFWIYKGRLLEQGGDYSASCSMFQRANARLDMQAMAESAFAAENWHALSVYLYCLGDPSDQTSGVSTPRISVLFFNLGKYFNQIGDNDNALMAYLSAVDWYPTVWADPILAAVKILEEKGLLPDAQKLVDKNFELATLPWSRFYLGRKLSEYKLGENDWLGAYCVLLQAKVGGEGSPINQVPEAPRGEVVKALNMLEAEYGLTPEQCNIAP